MNNIFAVSTLFGAMTIAAGLDSGVVSVEPGARRVLVVTNNALYPELVDPWHLPSCVAPVLRRFDDVHYLNELIHPMHPHRWLPEDHELPFLAKVLRTHWGLCDGPVRLYVDSLNTAPSLTLARIFHDAPVSVVAEGLMSMGPTPYPPPLTVSQRLEELVYLEILEGVRPLLLCEHAVRRDIVPPEAFTALIDEMVEAVKGGPDEVPDYGDVPTSLVLGQYLSALEIVSPDEEAALYVRMVDAATAHGARRVVFKPHPSASASVVELMRAEADRLHVGFSVLRTQLPAEAVAASTTLHSVVSCFSTALVTIQRLYDIEDYSVGADMILSRLTPYQDSNRVPLTIVDALAREDGRYSDVRALQRLIEAVAYCMQARTLEHLRPVAVEVLSVMPEEEVGRYFKRRRLTMLDLPGRLAPKPPPPQRRSPLRRARRALRRLLGR